MPRQTKPNPREVIAMIREEAASLRASGVLELEMDGWSVKLAPHQVAADPGPMVAASDPADTTPRHAPNPAPMDDPTTFGLEPGATLPGFQRPQPEEPS